MENIHASCVDINGNGILILGKSGCGKSDLALRLINEGAALVSDDRCEVYSENQNLIATAPKEIKNLLEIRGIGIVKLKTKSKTRIKLVINLKTLEEIERMPKLKTINICNIDIKEFSIYPFEASATAKVKSALNIAINETKIIK